MNASCEGRDRKSASATRSGAVRVKYRLRSSGVKRGCAYSASISPGSRIRSRFDVGESSASVIVHTPSSTPPRRLAHKVDMLRHGEQDVSINGASYHSFNI